MENEEKVSITELVEMNLKGMRKLNKDEYKFITRFYRSCVSGIINIKDLKKILNIY